MLKQYLLQCYHFRIVVHIPATMPASVAQLDARPAGDQEVAGSTPAGTAKFFRGD